MSTTLPPEDERNTPPAILLKDNLTAEVLRKSLWKPANRGNNWRVFVIVGREGSGKSHTAISILEKVDPSFNADRIHWRPDDFLESIKNIPKADRQGKAIMLDEAGVGMGVRTWYNSDQIMLNKVMQTARDDNMIVGMTLPRFGELDSQFRGRVHARLEMKELHHGEFARFKWKYLFPTRDERNKTYTYNPKKKLGSRKMKVTSLAVGPPTEALVKEYEAQKEAFKEKLYEEALEEYQDNGGNNRRSATDIGDEILDTGPEQYVQENPGGDYLDKKLIAADYDIGQEKAATVKAYVLRESDLDVR